LLKLFPEEGDETTPAAAGAVAIDVDDDGDDDILVSGSG
jgi:hypothetical protein